MASVVNDHAVETYVADMQLELAELLKKAGHPLAERAFELARDIRDSHTSNDHGSAADITV